MKNVMVLTAGMVVCILIGCARNVDVAVEKTKVDTVLDQNIQVIETEDVDLLSKIFAHDADMVIFGTDAAERVVGYNALKSVMKAQFESTEETRLSVKDRIIKIHESGRVAWFSEIIDWHIVSQGQTVNLEGVRGTGVLECRNGKWIVVQLHYSVPAVS
jgi:hypothetical protein